MAKIKRALKTLLIMGEGAHERAFLQHLKLLYDNRENGQKLTIDAASGGSPIEIIDETIRKSNHAGYDRKLILLDTDVKIRQQDRDKAKKNKIELIISTPVCLEGMLLDILGINVPESLASASCKSRLHARLAGLPTSSASYAELFTKPILDASAKEQIVKLKKIISNQ